MVSVYPPSSLQLQSDLRRHPRVVQGAVVPPVEASLGEEVQVDRFQGAVDQAREVETARLRRADVAIGETQFAPGELVAEEVDVEGRVVGDQDALRDSGAAFRGSSNDLDDAVDLARRQCGGFEIQDYMVLIEARGCSPHIGWKRGVFESAGLQESLLKLDWKSERHLSSIFDTR